MKELWLKQQFMKSDQKCNCNVSNACLCLQRSVLIQPCDLRLITTENVDVKCAAFKLVNMRSAKIAWGWICWTVKTFFCVVVEELTWFFMQVALKTSLEAAQSTRLVLSAILFTNWDENCGQKTVELISRYVFNCSRLFQWLTKFLPCV